MGAAGFPRDRLATEDSGFAFSCHMHVSMWAAPGQLTLCRLCEKCIISLGPPHAGLPMGHPGSPPLSDAGVWFPPLPHLLPAVIWFFKERVGYHKCLPAEVIPLHSMVNQ